MLTHTVRFQDCGHGAVLPLQNLSLKNLAGLRLHTFRHRTTNHTVALLSPVSWLVGRLAGGCQAGGWLVVEHDQKDKSVQMVFQCSPII